MDAQKPQRRVRRSEKKWCMEEDLKMVQMIKDNEAMWNPNHEYYKNRLVKDKIWNNIAVATNHSVSDTKNHWNTIRSRYNFERRKVNSTSRYHLYEHLQFLSGILPHYSVNIPCKAMFKRNSDSVHESDDQQVSEDNNPISDNEFVPKRLKTTFSSENLLKETEFAENSLKFASKIDATVRPILRCNLGSVRRSSSVCTTSSTRTKFHRNYKIPYRRDDKWKRVFGEYIFHELDRYSYADGQKLKQNILRVCLNFIPTDEHDAEL